METESVTGNIASKIAALSPALPEEVSTSGSEACLSRTSSSRQMSAGTHITDLPEDLICAVLGRLSPAEVCGAATVCTLFSKAARSDLTWNRFVPRGYHRVCQINASPTAALGCGKISESHKTSYMRLREGFFDPKCRSVHYKVDWATGAMSMSVSSTAMTSPTLDFEWTKESMRTWTTENVQNVDTFSDVESVDADEDIFYENPFKEAMCIHDGPPSFHIQGTVTCALPRGKYVCSWRLCCFVCDEYTVCSDQAKGAVLVEGGSFIESWMNIGVLQENPKWSDVKVGIIELGYPDGDVAERETSDEGLVSATIHFRFSHPPLIDRIVIFNDGYDVRVEELVVGSFVLRSASAGDEEGACSPHSPPLDFGVRHRAF